MRVPRAPRAPAEPERDPLLGPDGREPREDGLRPFGAELGAVVRALVGARERGRVRVQVEGVPGDGEGVRGVGELVGCDGTGEALVADVAPLRRTGY